MKKQGQAVDEVVSFILLRLCFNCLRDAWLPGGYPPKKDASKVTRTATLPPLSCVSAASQKEVSLGLLSLTKHVVVQQLQREPPMEHEVFES